MTLAHVVQCTCKLLYRGTRFSGILNFLVRLSPGQGHGSKKQPCNGQGRSNGREFLLNVEALKMVSSIEWMYRPHVQCDKLV